MNILVTGANGQLGNEMRIVSKKSADKYIFTDITQQEDQETIYLDITDMNAIRQMVKNYDVKVIVNCAAWTNVDSCETDENLAVIAKRLNADAPKNLASAMAEVNGTIFHISTDYVFGKEPYNTPCSPSQRGTPTGVYGATKLQGEKNIIESGCNYIILRTAWLYSEFGKNFCKTMLNLTKSNHTLKVVYDQCGTPTYAYDLASAILSIIECRKFECNTGIYHYSNEGVTSWYDFAVMIARIAGHKECDVQPCYSSEYQSLVRRPAYSVLDKKSFKDTFGLKIPYWVDSLEICINKLECNET